MAQGPGIPFPMYSEYNGYSITIAQLPPNTSVDVPMHPDWTLEEILGIIHYPTAQELHLLQELIDTKAEQITLLKEKIGALKEELRSCKAEIILLQKEITKLHEELKHSDLETTCLSESLKQSEDRNKNLHFQFQLSHSGPANAVNNSQQAIDNNQKLIKELKATVKKLQGDNELLNTENRKLTKQLQEARLKDT